MTASAAPKGDRNVGSRVEVVCMVVCITPQKKNGHPEVNPNGRNLYGHSRI